MSMCDRCRVSGCLLNYNGKACENARKEICPDVYYTNADHIRTMSDEELVDFMTKLEAIKYLQNKINLANDLNVDEFKEAMELAVVALKEQVREASWYHPCKPMDTVYFILCKTDGSHEIKKGWIQSVEYSVSTKPLLTIRYDDSSLKSTKHYLGLKAFRTYREAEEALKDLNF